MSRQGEAESERCPHAVRENRVSRLSGRRVKYAFWRGRGARILMCLRALTFVLAWLFVVPPAMGFLLRHIAALQVPHPPPGQLPPPRFLVIAECEAIAVVFALTCLLLLTERDGRSRLGSLFRLPHRSNLAGGGRAWFWLACGTTTGGILLVLLMGVLILAGGYAISPSPAPAVAILHALLVYCALFAAVGVCEEVGFRGYLQRALEDGLGFWPATLITSALFGVAHASGIDTWAGSADTVLFAIFACLTLRYTGSLWFAIGYHASWDFTETAIFGTPNGGVNLPQALAHATAIGPAWLTGGAAGPEASIPCFIQDVLLLVVAMRLRGGVSAQGSETTGWNEAIPPETPQR
jgi:membrane protease YdiL (CAAX protease family)